MYYIINFLNNCINIMFGNEDIENKVFKNYV